MARDFREIPLTRGQVAIVDEGDYDYLMQWKWHACWGPVLKAFYAARMYQVDRQRVHVQMHRLLLGLEKGDKRVVDHKNHNTLDNRRSNLRICTQAQNLCNMRMRPTNTSGYTGVSWTKNNKWQVSFKFNKKNYLFGQFDSLEAAAAVYKARSYEIRGEFNRQEVT